MKRWLLIFCLLPLFAFGQTSFVQNIINTGGTLPTATYTCSSLTVPLSFNLHGSTINFTNTTGASLRVTANNVTIQNGTIVGLTGSFSSGQSAIQDNFANCSITGLVIKQYGQYAISASSNSPTNINNLSITNNNISDIGNIAISVITNFGTVTGITVSGNTINRSMQPAPTVPNAAIIIRNFAPGSMTGAIVATNNITMPSNPSILAAEICEVRGCINAQFHDNICTGGTIGCSAVLGSNNFQCFNNTFSGQNNEALECGDLLNSNFHNNTITSGRIGMLFDGGSLCTLDTLQSTTMTGLTSYPIQFYQSAVHGITINSVVANTTTFAILVQQGAYGITVNNSHFTGNGTSYAIKIDQSIGGLKLNNSIFTNFQPKIIVATASSAITVNNIIGVNISPTTPSGFLSVFAGVNVTLGPNISFNAGPPLPIVSYSPNTYVYVINNAISPVSPTSTGGSVSGYTITPSQSGGLLFNTTTGVLSGTPLVLSPKTTYNIVASNSSGSVSTPLTVTVIDRAPNLTYAPVTQSAVINTPITNFIPSNGGGAILNFTVTPALPLGVSLNSSTGVVSGTPTVLSPYTGYTLTGFNSGGSSPFVIHLSVSNPAPVVPNISFSPNNYNLPINTTIANIVPINIGGTSSSWAISPALSTGLNFDVTTGIVSGLPTALLSSTPFDISATNISGTSHTTLTLRVTSPPPPAPVIAYSPNTVTLTVNQSAILFSPSNTGGFSTNYTILPSLSSGLVIDNTTGIISGVPTSVTPLTHYIISASNLGGVGTAPFTVTVAPQTLPPTILVRDKVGIVVFP